ncbi:MAG: AGE family epimerase/isomerase [Litoreibacter sp.]|uniref:AGE family epimerase/isomerase n=1 Tax=Litoreibacter sp. TaxID=1969459 RepID=UPI0032973E95
MTASDRDAEYWSAWFWSEFFPDWLGKAQDGDWGVFDALDADGNSDPTATKSILAQARTLFMVSHVALLSRDAQLLEVADKLASFLKCFRKAPGLYRCAIDREGNPTGLPADEMARSYDQTFVILGLVTWNQLSPSPENEQLIEECWEALQTQLTDTKTGLLLNNDVGNDLNPAQNPHMHLFEACLQGYRMTKDSKWLTRAADLRAIGLKHFFDQDTGSLAEFIQPDLSPLVGRDGLRREVGHQCEWAWLLLEEAQLADDPSLEVEARRLFEFADRFGYSTTAPLVGAAYDAISAQGDVMESNSLLWPQTEAIKALALLHVSGEADAGQRACSLMCLMFEAWFKGRPIYVNQLDTSGDAVWSEALTRLMYHVVLAMTEGARAGLWSDVADNRG